MIKGEKRCVTKTKLEETNDWEFSRVEERYNPHIEKTLRLSIGMGKVIATQIMQKGLIFEKKHSNNTIKNWKLGLKGAQNKNRQRIWTGNSQKKKLEWPKDSNSVVISKMQINVSNNF